MFRISLKLFLIIAVVLSAGELVTAQSETNSSISGSPQKEDYPKNIQESLAKQRIEREKKDFAEMLTRGEEAVKISKELEKSFTRNNQLSAEDRKKLDHLEKLVKKIRSELGGGDDNDEYKSEFAAELKSVENALNVLQNNSVKLADELKKTTRYTVSVGAVENSNSLLNILRFLRFWKN